MDPLSPRLPATGLDRDTLLRLLEEARSGDAAWNSGRIWSLVYHAGAEHTDLLVEAFRRYSGENALSPAAFPSLRRFEREVVGMLRELLRGDAEVVGAMTSGGTESILLAVKAYRDRARARGTLRGQPEMILPDSAHPAFLKAAQYFDVIPRIIPVGPDYRADPESMARAITAETILLVASAPCFPYGTVDPIAELGEIAQNQGIGLHVDACVGGMMLPFLRRLGLFDRPFDFAVPGVTSVSADLHKYGYALKGAAAVLYRGSELRRHQFFADTRWSGGLFGSPGLLGTRSGGILAAAWTSMMALGEAGYLDLARRTHELTLRLRAGITALPGLRLVGHPDATLFAFEAEGFDIFAVAEAMSAAGWHIDRQNRPDSIHLVVTPHHEPAAPGFLADLERAVQQVSKTPAPSRNRTAALYGVTSSAEGPADPREAILSGLESSLDHDPVSRQ